MNKKAFFVIHGYAGGKYQIEPFLYYLSHIDDYDVITPRLTGHGETFEELDLTNASRSRWMMDVVDKFYEIEGNYEEIVVCGHSMGGLLSVNLHRLVRSKKISNLVLLAPAFYISDFVSSKSLSRLIDEGSANLAATDHDSQVRRVKKLTITSFYELAKLSVETREYLKDINIPVFIGQGDMDGLVKDYSPIRAFEALPKNPRNQVHIYHGAKHSIAYYEHNLNVFTDVYNFLFKNQTK